MEHMERERERESSDLCVRGGGGVRVEESKREGR